MFFTIDYHKRSYSKDADPEGMKVYINSLKISDTDLPKTAVVGEVAALPNGYKRHRLYRESSGIANVCIQNQN